MRSCPPIYPIRQAQFSIVEHLIENNYRGNTAWVVLLKAKDWGWVLVLRDWNWVCFCIWIEDRDRSWILNLNLSLCLRLKLWLCRQIDRTSSISFFLNKRFIISHWIFINKFDFVIIFNFSKISFSSTQQENYIFVFI